MLDLRKKRAAETGNPCLIDCKCGCTYANGISVTVEGLDMFRLGAITAIGRISILFEKNRGRLCVWDVKRRSVGIALADGLCDPE
jgi:hypothetical protein